MADEPHAPARAPVAEWRGAQGTPYRFWVYPLGCRFAAGQAGTYIIARRRADGWDPLYVGQGDLDNRSRHHHQADCLRARGATHIHARAGGEEPGRIAERDDILAAHPAAEAPRGCNERFGRP
jgi:hypothetical protein